MMNKFDDMADMPSRLGETVAVHLSGVEAEVNRLISEHNRNEQAIEQQLDTLLSHAMLNVGEMHSSGYRCTTRRSIRLMLHTIGTHTCRMGAATERA